MELREGDVAENQNRRSSRWAAEYSLTFEMVLPDGRVQFCFSNSPAGRPHPIDKPASADRSGNRTRSNCTWPPRGRTVYLDFWPRPPPSVPYSIEWEPIVSATNSGKYEEVF